MTEVLVSEIILPMMRINQAMRALQAVGRRSSGVWEKTTTTTTTTTKTMADDDDDDDDHDHDDDDKDDGGRQR